MLIPSPILKFERRGFYSVSLTEAQVVVCYLYPGAMERLRGKFESELSGGAWVGDQSHICCARMGGGKGD